MCLNSIEKRNLPTKLNIAVFYKKRKNIACLAMLLFCSYCKCPCFTHKYTTTTIVPTLYSPFDENGKSL